MTKVMDDSIKGQFHWTEIYYIQRTKVIMKWINHNELIDRFTWRTLEKRISKKEYRKYSDDFSTFSNSAFIFSTSYFLYFSNQLINQLQVLSRKSNNDEYSSRY